MATFRVFPAAAAFDDDDDDDDDDENDDDFDDDDEADPNDEARALLPEPMFEAKMDVPNGRWAGPSTATTDAAATRPPPPPPPPRRAEADERSLLAVAEACIVRRLTFARSKNLISTTVADTKG